LGSFKLKLVDLCLEPTVLFVNLGNFKFELVDLLLEPTVLFTDLGKLGRCFAQFFDGLVPILFNLPRRVSLSIDLFSRLAIFLASAFWASSSVAIFSLKGTSLLSNSMVSWSLLCSFRRSSLLSLRENYKPCIVMSHLTFSASILVVLATS